MVERFGLQALVLALVLMVAGAVGAATSAAPEPATLRILNREIVTFRAELLGAAPAHRVERARDRLRQIPDAAIDRPITTVSAEIGAA
ncbi:MAG: hypothetical protein H6R03_377, partial [Burkholderiaceae bacterium]|nr:hypothetical protein [Burkholderiaceae bacterium]